MIIFLNFTKDKIIYNKNNFLKCTTKKTIYVVKIKQYNILKS